MKITIGLLESKLETDNPKIIQALYDKYAFRVPGYNYIPSYKQGRWDGKKRYFRSNGTFKTGLFKRIVDDIKSIGCTNYIFELDKDNVSKLTWVYEPKSVKNFKYREYQKEAIKEACFRGRLIIESPTGSGKTLIMAGILKTLDAENHKAIVLFREKGILNQTYEFFKKCGLKNLGINSGDGYIRGNIMLSTVQSISKIFDDYRDSDILMVDEVHQFCKGEITVAAIESFPNAHCRVGFTATVPSEKGDIHGRITLEGAFGPVYSTRSIDDLIKEGSIAKPIIQIINYSPSGDFVGMSYQDLYDEHIINSVERNQKIIDIVSAICSKHKCAKVLILVKNLHHLSILKSMIPNCFSVEGKDTIEDRYHTINDFIDNNQASVIIGTNVMQTGISIDEITHMINARGLEGEIPTIQGLGRGVRRAIGKTEVYFYDFYDKVKYLEKHSKKRIKHYAGLNLEINYVKLN